MVARRFIVRHNDDDFPVDYDTDDGLKVLRFQIYCLTSVPPDEQKIVATEDGSAVTEDSDLSAISGKLRLLSIQEDAEQNPENLGHADKSDEELALILQAREEALFYQQSFAGEDRGEFEQRVRSYVAQVLMYEDPV